MKRPAFQFYPADWKKDPALSLCSIAARGLWIEIMCIAHESEQYGYLVINGKAMSTAQIARLVGDSPAAVKKALDELEAAGVPSRDERGALYSRRMVKDEALRNVRADGGKGGKEHGIKGAEHGHKGGRPRKGRGVILPPLNPPPSSSPSSSTSVILEKDSLSPTPTGTSSGSKSLPLPFDSQEFAKAWEEWGTHRRQKRVTLTALAASKQLSSLREMGESRAIRAINHSIEKGYTGIFEPSGQGGQPRGQGTFRGIQEEIDIP